MTGLETRANETIVKIGRIMQEKTLRDEFAMSALNAMSTCISSEVRDFNIIAKNAYLIADAMLRARKSN